VEDGLVSPLSEERLQATGDVHRPLNYCKWTAHRVEVVSKPEIVYDFCIGTMILRTYTNPFLLFSAFLLRILYFCVKK
jgi:hypothetical protein